MSKEQKPEYSFDEVQRLFDAGDLPALFDMVWRAGEAEGEQNERESIVNLLESDKCFCTDLTVEELKEQVSDDKERFFRHSNCPYDSATIDYQIGRIKGEQK